MRILVIEDDDKIGQFIVHGLRQEGHVVDWSRDGEDGCRLALEGPFEAVILDLMLPRRDGLSLLAELRRLRRQLPVIILSAKSDVGDRIAGLSAGADDYLTKPFSFAELLARLQALVRRSSNAVEHAKQLTYADLTLDLESRRVTRGGRSIELQAREFTLLAYLLRNADRVLSKTMILEHVWSYSFDPQTNVVDVLVSRLRRKIDRDFPVKLIHTLRGVGYVLRKD
ncbi:MAG TPA: response regulator transcription factor [Polyangia bacterium]|jgi:two-component system OmpR family response regulator|nr:response regulator transcription factor [Polyangia bacterium]